MGSLDLSYSVICILVYTTLSPSPVWRRTTLHKATEVLCCMSGTLMPPTVKLYASS